MKKKVGPPRINMIGKKHGRLTVIKHHHPFKTKSGSRNYWLCKCECGNKAIVDGNKMRSGHTQSCGCLQKEAARRLKMTHGMTGTKIYHIYNGMLARCTNKNLPSYKDYGGRGIKICASWVKDFRSFQKWAVLHGYKQGLSIERINNNGNYTPRNCRWATSGEQARNTRRNNIIKIYGQTYILVDAAKRFGLSRATIRSRLKKGLSNEQAVGLL